MRNPLSQEMIEEVPEFGLFYMKRTNLFRQGCIYFMNTQSFKTGTLLAILVNCAFLAMDTNRPGYPATEAGRASLLAECASTLPPSPSCRQCLHAARFSA